MGEVTRRSSRVGYTSGMVELAGTTLGFELPNTANQEKKNPNYEHEKRVRGTFTNLQWGCFSRTMLATSVLLAFDGTTVWGWFMRSQSSISCLLTHGLLGSRMLTRLPRGSDIFETKITRRWIDLYKDFNAKSGKYRDLKATAGKWEMDKL